MRDLNLLISDANKFVVLWFAHISWSLLLEGLIVDSTIHWINLFAVNSALLFVNSYPTSSIYLLDGIIHPLNNGAVVS